MKLSKLKGWGKILLPAFLLIILIQGVIQLPEVRVRFFPEKIWQNRLFLVARGCDQVKEFFTVLDAELAALDSPQGPVFSPNFKNNREVPSFFQILINAWYSMVAPTSQISHEKHHYLARKLMVHLEMRLTYLELLLNNLLFSTNSQRIDGISYSRNHDTLLIQKQTETWRQECQQFKTRLNVQAKRLQQLIEHADKQINKSAKVVPRGIE